MKNRYKLLGFVFILSLVAISMCMLQARAGGGAPPTSITTNTFLDAISTPLTAGQSGVAFSGEVSSFIYGYWPGSGDGVTLYYSSSPSGPWTEIGSTTTTSTQNLIGTEFSGTFNVPPGISAGTYYFQAKYEGGHAYGASLDSSVSLSNSDTNVKVLITPALVLPEYAFAALGALGACIVAFGVFKTRGKIKL